MYLFVYSVKRLYQCGCWGLDYSQYDDFNKALKIVREGK